MTRFQQVDSSPFDYSIFLNVLLQYQNENLSFEDAYQEILNGRKKTHWIWYVFPQVNPPDSIPTSRVARDCGIPWEQCVSVARTIIDHPVLGKRLRDILYALASHTTSRPIPKIIRIMSTDIDCRKLLSSLTLFERAAHGLPLHETIYNIITDFYQSERCEHTTRAILEYEANSSCSESTEIDFDNENVNTYSLQSKMHETGPIPLRHSSSHHLYDASMNSHVKSSTPVSNTKQELHFPNCVPFTRKLADGKTLSVAIGDITLSEADAIVNATNSELNCSSGVSGAIFRAAGGNLPADCSKLAPCPTGSAKITAAYNLPAKHIIHAVGPEYRGGGEAEDILLEYAYKNSLKRANEAKVRSIAFPAISTGIYHYPIDKAAMPAIEAIRAWNHPYPTSFTFVVQNMNTFNAFKHAISMNSEHHESKTTPSTCVIG